MVGNPSAAPARTYLTAESVLYGMDADANGEYVDPATWNPETDALNLSVRTEHFRYIHRSRDFDELYDHTIDPGEQHNLASDPAYQTTRTLLRDLLADEVSDVFPHCL